MKLSSRFREFLKVTSAMAGATACMFIGGYLYATSPNPIPAIGFLEQAAILLVITTVLGGLGFLTEEEVEE